MQKPQKINCLLVNTTSQYENESFFINKNHMQMNSIDIFFDEQHEELCEYLQILQINYDHDLEIQSFQKKTHLEKN